MAARKQPANIDEAKELVLTADNDSRIYGQKKSILLNLAKKLAAGKYDGAKAPKLWQYWIDAEAKHYEKDFPGVKFSPATRQLAAKMIAVHEGNMLKRGDYSSLIDAVTHKKR